MPLGLQVFVDRAISRHIPKLPFADLLAALMVLQQQVADFVEDDQRSTIVVDAGQIVRGKIQPPVRVDCERTEPGPFNWHERENCGSCRGPAPACAESGLS